MFLQLLSQSVSSRDLHSCAASAHVVRRKEPVPYRPAMQSLLLGLVRRLQTAPSQHCAAMGTPSIALILGSWTHLWAPDPPCSTRVPWLAIIGFMWTPASSKNAELGTTSQTLCLHN